MKKILTIAIVALLGLSSCHKTKTLEPTPTKLDTMAREFKVVSLYPQSWIVLLNNNWAQSNIVDTIDATHISTKFYFHKNDSIRFVDNGTMDNKLYIFNPSVLITQKQCSNCTMDYKFKMN